MYYVVAKYISKYGQIVYCAKISDNNVNVDLNNVYINTFYFKGSEQININQIYNFFTIKGENGFTYAILT